MATRGRGRGRPRKPRESRMDAAVDAMGNFGFEEKLVKATVKELLKVYGGAEAWPLIEDGYYSALLEILLKKNAEKKGGDEEGKSKDNEGGEEGANQPEQEQAPVSDQIMDDAPEGNAKPLNGAEPPFSDATGNASGNDDNIGMGDSQRGDVDAPAISDVLLGAGMGESQRGDVDAPAINLDVNLESTGMDLPLGILPPEVPPETIANQRRKPCHGWLSDEDEYMDGIVYVSARLPVKPRRMSRWDLAPDNIENPSTSN